MTREELTRLLTAYHEDYYLYGLGELTIEIDGFLPFVKLKQGRKQKSIRNINDLPDEWLGRLVATRKENTNNQR